MSPSSNPRNPRSILAKKRARARRDDAGAVIFIVATTLGVLAVMGVYALTATTQDLRAAGNVQRAAQANYVNSYGAIATAEYVNYDNADDIVNRRMLNPNASASAAEKNCISTQRNDPVLFGDERTKSCVRIAAVELKVPWGGQEPFTSQSFTHNTLPGQEIDADVYTELTNPTDAAPPPGYNLDSNFKFVMVTATSFGIVKPRGTIGTETLRQGRGRFIIGPVKR